MLALLGLALVVAPIALAAWVKVREGRAARAAAAPALRRWTRADDRDHAADWRIVARVQRQAGLVHAAAASEQIARHHDDRAARR